MTLAIILAIGSLLWATAWFIFKFWLIGKGLQLGGTMLQYYGRKMEEMDSPQHDPQPDPEEDWGHLFSNAAPENYGQHISTLSLPSDTTPKGVHLRIIEGGKR